MTVGARSRMTPTCDHGNTIGACLDCHRDKHQWDRATGTTDDSAGPTAHDPGAIALRDSGQNYFITTIPTDEPDYWTIAKEKGLWGTRLQSSRAAAEVRAGDLIAIWEPKRGLRAVLKAVSLAQRPRTPDDFPWADPDTYVYLFPIEVLVELDEPIEDDFDQPDRISARLRLQNSQAQPGFRRLDREQMTAILAAVAKAGA
jgi:hypothetical protein